MFSSIFIKYLYQCSLDAQFIQENNLIEEVLLLNSQEIFVRNNQI